MIYKTRFLWDILAQELETREAVVVTGARQSGKTTTLRWLLDQVQSDNKIFLDLALESTRTLFEEYDAEGIAHALQTRGVKLTERAYVAIDEIQYSKKVPLVVKYLIDHYRMKFYLTGSSAFYLKNQFSESMAGRKLIFELFPLSFQEFLVFKQITYALPALFTNATDINACTFNSYAFNVLQAYYEEFILYGGFPAVVLEQNVQRKQMLLDEIYTSYIDLDVEHLSDFKAIAELKRLIPLLAARIGSRINIEELSVIVGLSQPTVRTYVDFLQKTYLIRLLPVTSGNRDVKTRKQSKLYFVDTGIASRNADISGGAKFENALCHQLQRYGALSYYDGLGEIDFVLDTGATRYALEAKETPVPAQKKMLHSRAAQLGVPDFNLIGRYKSAKYHNYLWGGLIA